MQNSMMMFTFSVLDQKIPFLGKFVQNIKIVSLNWNLVLILIICKIQWWCSLFPFSTKNTFFEVNLVQKIKFVGLNWNLVLNSFEYAQFNGDADFFCFWPKIHFLGKFGAKNQNCQFKLKFSSYTNSNLQKLVVNFLFLFSTGNTSFKQTCSKISKLSV